jgi:hypothetical protein
MNIIGGLTALCNNIGFRIIRVILIITDIQVFGNVSGLMKFRKIYLILWNILPERKVV